MVTHEPSDRDILDRIITLKDGIVITDEHIVPGELLSVQGDTLNLFPVESSSLEIEHNTLD